VAEARAQWAPVWVVVDGSTDGTADGLQRMARADPGLRVWVLPVNVGKGAAVLHGLEQAQAAGFTHALTMDSDGQHPAELIPAFMQASFARPEVMVLGRPVFDASAPLLRVRGRKVSNGGPTWRRWVPAWPTRCTAFASTRSQRWRGDAGQPWMRRFDFDTEAVVRLAWRGVKPVNIDAPVKYLTAEEGGVSHFQYGRDNALLTGCTPG
jgi:glycosyltransferase involved in cell wall biosynthesis